MTNQNNNEVAIVTGGSVGIGRAIAKRLLNDGFSVTICARTKEKLEQTENDLGEIGDVLGVQADIAKTADVKKINAQTVNEFGPASVLVNNAAIMGSGLTTFDKLTLDDWLEVFQVNLFGSIQMTKEVLPAMREANHGRIINLLSSQSVRPDESKPHYGASKAALLNLTKSLSKAYGGDGVLVNAVTPTVTRTPMVEAMFEDYAKERNETIEEVEDWYVNEKRSDLVIGRVAEPSEVANVISFLVSDEASFVSGANYRVEGGAISTINI